MSEKSNELSALETRKQLLLVESELNRAHLINDLHQVKAVVAHWTDQARAVGTLASTAAKLGTSVAGFFRGFSNPEKNEKDGDKKPSFISSVFKGATAGVSLWSALRSRIR